MTGFSEGGQIPYWVNCGIYVLSAGGARALPRPRRPRDDDLPGARRRGRLFAYRHEGLWLTVNTPKELRAARRARRGASGVACRERIAAPMTGLAEPRVPGRLGVRAAARRQAVGLRADLGADGRLLRQGPVREGRASRSRSSSTARRTSRGWSSPAARRSSWGTSGESVAEGRGRRRGRRLPLLARHGAPGSRRSRTRRSSRSRPPTWTTSSACRTTTAAPAPRRRRRACARSRGAGPGACCEAGTEPAHGSCHVSR